MTKKIIDTDIKLLKDLIDIPSPSGFERNIAEYIYDYLVKKIDPSFITIDFQNNVVVTLKGKSNKTILIDAHLDEIGFIVTNVDRWGKISINYIGGGDNTILSARNLRILTKNGVLNAVVDRKHAHMVYDEDLENIYRTHDAELDIGIKDREKILNLISIADPVVFESGFRRLVNNCYSGYGFDDKSGCFILLKTIELLSKKELEHNLVFLFSSQEETGTSKIFPIVRTYKPDLVIELDVTFATDYGDDEDMEKEVGRCNLGDGIVIYKGVDIFKEGVMICEQIAKEKKIPYQIQACGGRIGYTSLETTGMEQGIEAMVFGIPLRNMHSPVEVINYNDLISGINLLEKFLLSKEIFNGKT